MENPGTHRNSKRYLPEIKQIIKARRYYKQKKNTVLLCNICKPVNAELFTDDEDTWNNRSVVLPTKTKDTTDRPCKQEGSLFWDI